MADVRKYLDSRYNNYIDLNTRGKYLESIFKKNGLDWKIKTVGKLGKVVINNKEIENTFNLCDENPMFASYLDIAIRLFIEFGDLFGVNFIPVEFGQYAKRQGYYIRLRKWAKTPNINTDNPMSVEDMMMAATRTVEFVDPIYGRVGSWGDLENE